MIKMILRNKYDDALRIVVVLLLGAPGVAWAQASDVQCSGCVDNADIADVAITQSKIANRAVTSNKLGLGSIQPENFAAGSVTLPKLAEGAVGESKIGDGAVSSSKLQANAVTLPKIADGAVGESKIGNGAVSASKLQSNAVVGSKIADGAVTSAKLSPNVAVLDALSCSEGQVPILSGGLWVCGNVAMSSNLSGFGLPFSTDENNRNVLVYRQVNPDGSVAYSLRIRFQATSFQISVNGTPTNVPFVAMYPSAFVDSGGTITNVNNYIDAPATANYVDYLVEQSQFDPTTLVKTVTADTERWVDTCGSEAGGAVSMCIGRVTASLDDAFQYFWFYSRGARVLLGPYQINGIAFSNVRMDTRRDGNTYRLRAEGIGMIWQGQAGSAGLGIIYYRVNGQTGGSLAGTPFEPGVGQLDGLFF